MPHLPIRFVDTAKNSRSADRAVPVHRPTRRDHCVDDAIFQRLICFHNEITVCISVDALDWLTCVLSENPVQNLTHSQNFVCGEFKICDLTVPNLA